MISTQLRGFSQKFPKQALGVWDYQELSAWLDDSGSPSAGPEWHAWGEQIIFLIDHIWMLMRCWKPQEPVQIFKVCMAKYGDNFLLGEQITMCLLWLRQGAFDGNTAEQLDAIEHHRRRFFPCAQDTWELHTRPIGTMFRPVDPTIRKEIVESKAARGTVFQGFIPTHRMALRYEAAMHAIYNQAKDGQKVPNDVDDYPYDDPEEQLNLVGRIYNAMVNETTTYEGCESQHKWPLKNRTILEVEVVSHRLVHSILIAEAGFNKLHSWFTSKGLTFEKYDSFQDRFLRVERNLKDNKTLANSLFDVPWEARIAQAPELELKGKLGNRILNSQRKAEKDLLEKYDIVANNDGTLTDRSGNPVSSERLAEIGEDQTSMLAPKFREAATALPKRPRESRRNKVLRKIYMHFGPKEGGETLIMHEENDNPTIHADTNLEHEAEENAPAKTLQELAEDTIVDYTVADDNEGNTVEPSHLNYAPPF